MMKLVFVSGSPWFWWVSTLFQRFWHNTDTTLMTNVFPEVNWKLCFFFCCLSLSEFLCSETRIIKNSFIICTRYKITFVTLLLPLQCWVWFICFEIQTLTVRRRFESLTLKKYFPSLALIKYSQRPISNSILACSPLLEHNALEDWASLLVLALNSLLDSYPSRKFNYSLLSRQITSR